MKRHLRKSLRAAIVAAVIALPVAAATPASDPTAPQRTLRPFSGEPELAALFRRWVDEAERRRGEQRARQSAGGSAALAQAARTVGSPQIRHAGTVGGNLGTCSPAGDGLPPLAALDATVHLVSAGGTRDVPFAEFMTGPKRNVLLHGELIAGVTLPVVSGWQGYTKVGVRNAMVIATASVALVADDVAQSVRVALGSVGPVILRCPEAEEFAAGEVDFGQRRVADAAVAEFARLAAAAARPIDDHRSTAAYRRHAVGVLAARLLRRAFPNG